MTPTDVPPDADEIEVSFFGPGYGECILVHIGNQQWVTVDSCLDSDRQATALNYLRRLGSNPAKSVCLLVATHWHDDHIRGMGELVEVCESAIFCCAATLRQKEFLATLAALEGRPATPRGSGLQELFKVFSLLTERSATCRRAFSNRLILSQSDCEVWALSPSDGSYDRFLRQIGQLIPQVSEAKRRIPSLTPNQASVVLLFSIGDVAILLGADLEKRGWLEVLDDYGDVSCRPSVFKVPHHGSKDAHEDRVWNEILDRDPIVTLTPWRRGGQELPTQDDARRILSFSSRAYVTTSKVDIAGVSRRRSNMVDRTIRESGARVRTVGLTSGMIRLRKKINSPANWRIEQFGSACILAAYA